MIPVEFSYLRTIFGKSGQGSSFTGLPGKCRELLSYLSVHFFMEKDEQLVMNRFQPVFIPAGNTVMWEFEAELTKDLSENQYQEFSTQTSYKSSKILSISRIKRNIFLTYYAGDIEIEDSEAEANKIDSYQLSHFLMVGMDSLGATDDNWIYTDLVPDCSENSGQPDSDGDFSNDIMTKNWTFLKSGLVNRMRRWFYFLFHHHYDRISPPGYAHNYHSSLLQTKSDCGIRAGPW